MIRFGIIGFGLAAKVFHLPVLTRISGAQVTCVCSSKPPEEVQQVLPDAQVYATSEAFFADAQVDVVLILTPNDLHATLATQAIDAGMHVIIDKPFVCNVAEGEALIAHAKAKGKMLSVYHNRRWDGDFLTVQQLINDKVLENVSYFESRFDKYRPKIWGRWREQDRPGAGLPFDLGSHLVDQALQLFGTPKAVSGQLLKQRPEAQAADYFAIQLHYEKTQVLLRGSSLAKVTPHRFYIEAANGQFVKGEQDIQETQMADNMSPYDPAWGVDPEAHYGQLHLRDADTPETVPTVRGCYQHYYENIMAVLKEGAELLVTPEQALDVVKVIQLAQVATETGEVQAFD